jgi:putative DNA primase/helicase
LGLEGLARLDRQGRFTEPQSSRDAYMQLQDLASPVGAFVRDWCIPGPEYQISAKQLYRAWNLYADEHGEHRKTDSTFGADLRAVAPQVRRTRRRDDGLRAYHYTGITLSPEAERRLREQIAV